MQLNDVTLREGDQMPGRTFTVEEKIECAHALDSLGVPFIQPGFPITGEKDQRVVSELAESTSADIVALARALEGDIDAAIDANADVVELFVSASDRHLEHLLETSRTEMHRMLEQSVAYVRERGGTPHVTLVDAFRTDHENLVRIFELIPDVPCITLADTVGARTPASVAVILDALGDHVELSRLGVHFHDDLGCATANALEAYRAGVGKADVSVAGLGERAGNSVLEEVLAACVTDHDDSLGVETGELVPVCRHILDVLGEDYSERKPVIGRAIAEHESGIHTSAMLSDPATLEPYDPAVFGGSRCLLFGASTGTSSSRKLLERAGIEPEPAVIEQFQDRLALNGPLELDDALALAEQLFTE